MEKTSYNLENIELQSYHCDRTDHLSLWGLCRIFQEASAHHTDGTAIGYRELLKDGKAWVLSRMYYEIHSMPTLNETVSVKTWARSSNGLYAIREFLMQNSKGENLCGASTYWVIIDMRARKVCRLNDMSECFAHLTDQATTLDSFNKLKLPPFVDDEKIARILASDSLIDHTQHVNNAEYIRLMGDYLQTQNNLHGFSENDSCSTSTDNVQFLRDKLKISRFDGLSFQIDYPLETRPGEMIDIYRRISSDAVSFQCSNPRGVAAVATFSWK